jgi:hypothetical protein
MLLVPHGAATVCRRARRARRGGGVRGLVTDGPPIEKYKICGPAFVIVSISLFRS